MSASGSAKSRMERILRLHDQIDEIKGDIREVYAEEKGDGGDKTAMGAAISHLRKRAKDKDAFDEREALAAVYLNAYNGASHTHAREASQSYAEAKGRDADGFPPAIPFHPKPVTDTQEQPEEPATQSENAASAVISPNEYAGTSSDENPAPHSNPQPAASLGADTAGDVPPPEWRPVEEYEGLYEVSDTGLVRNANTGNLLSQFQTDRGYFIVKLFRDNVGKNHKVHRLVATAFIRPPVEDEEVNHIDFDKAHNVASNLEWVTSQENIAHFLDANPGFNTQNRGFSEDQVHSIRLRVASGESKRSIARDLSVAKATIDALIAGQTYSGVSPATLSDADVPAFLKPEQRKSIADYRPNCLHPDACAATVLTHCYTCRRAMEAASETEEVA